MTVQKMVSTKVTLTKSPKTGSESYPVKVDGESRSFQLDGQLESFVPSNQENDIRNLYDAAALIQDPKVQAKLDRIRSHGSLGGKVDLEGSGKWDVYGNFGSFSISRLEPKDGNRHRVEFSSRHLSIYNETTVGADKITQQVVADYDLRTGEYSLREERLTVDETV